MNFINKHKILLDIFILLVFVFFTIFSNSLLFDSGIINGEDLRFHLARIQGLTENLKNGIWYPYINMQYLKGFGYAVDTFYSNTFLYFAALFQILVKDNLLLAYRFLVLFITFMTLVITYLSLKGVSHSRAIGFFTSVIYTLSSYHFIDTYNRAALGEMIAFAFVPIILTSFYMMICQKKNVWYWLVIGMSALIMTHVVTTVMIGTILIVFLIISYNKWKDTPKILLWLFFSACLVFGLTFFITGPLIEQTVAQPLVAQYAPVFDVSSMGLDLGNSIIHAFNNDDARNGKMVDIVNIGLLVLLAPILRLFLFEKKWMRGDLYLLIGLVLLFVSSKIFPWILFDQTILNVIQFPWRYLVFVTFFLAVASGIYINEMIQLYNRKRLIYSIFILSVIITNISLLHQASYEDRKPSAEALLKDYEFLGAGREYLPTGVKLSDITPDSGPLYVNDNIHYSDFRKKGSSISFSYQNTDMGEIAMPIVYYKGYAAHITENGKTYQIPVYAGITNLATIELPKGTGIVTFDYKGTTMQKVSKIISALFLAVFVGLISFHLFKKRRI